MQRRNLTRLLLVALVTLVVAAGAATAHGVAGPSTGDGVPANGTWWPGDLIAPDTGYWAGTHMGSPAMMGGYVGDAAGPYDCGGAWTGGMAGSYGGMAGYGGTGGHGGMMGGSGGWGMAGSSTWGLGFLWPLLLVALAVGLGYVVLTRSDRTGGDRALEVLRERYARGELSDDEYVSRREALRG